MAKTLKTQYAAVEISLQSVFFSFAKIANFSRLSARRFSSSESLICISDWTLERRITLARYKHHLFTLKHAANFILDDRSNARSALVRFLVA